MVSCLGTYLLETIDKIATNDTAANDAIATTYPGATLTCSSITAEIVDETKDVINDQSRFLFIIISFLFSVWIHSITLRSPPYR